jgi:hypothetical protein
MRLTLRLGDGQITGEGHDCIGPFTFEGHYDSLGKILMVKQYIGKHSLIYEGDYDGEGTIFGRWSYSPSWTGAFALKFEAADIHSEEAAVESVAEYSEPQG